MKKHLITIWLCSLLICAAVWTLCASIDPLGQFHKNTCIPQGVAERWINPGLLKHSTYNKLILGSSMSQNTLASDADSILGPQWIRASLPGASGYEMRKTAEIALNSQQLTDVIIILDFFSFTGQYDRRGDPNFPTFLYDTSPLNTMRYLSNTTTLKQTMQRLRGSECQSIDSLGFWAHQKKYGHAAVIENWQSGNFNTNFKSENFRSTLIRASLDSNLFTLIQRHPETQFHLILPPYSILMWLDAKQRHYLSAVLDFRHTLGLFQSQHANVDLYDLQADSSIIFNFANYTDVTHHRASINKLELSIVKSGTTVTSAEISHNSITIQRLLSVFADTFKVQRSTPYLFN